MAPALIKAYDWVRAQVTNLKSEIAYSKRTDATKKRAFGIQLAMYAILTLLDLIDMWPAARDYTTTGEGLLGICSRVVDYCDGRIAEESNAALAHELTNWIREDNDRAIPDPLHLRKDAELTKLSRLAEFFGFGNISLWTKSE